MAEYIERGALDNGEKIVFNAIVEFFNKNKFPPTIRELCKLTGYKSTCTVQNKLKSLELKGYIETNKMEKRTLRIKESTADVVPVVKGHWTKRVFIVFDSEIVGYKCSECNTTWETSTPYCPNCGAKMDGERRCE